MVWRQVTDAESALLDEHHGSPLQLVRGLRQNLGEKGADAVSLEIGEPEYNHACRGVSGTREDRSEIQIRGHYDPRLRHRLREDLLIGQPPEPLLTQMDGIIPAARSCTVRAASGMSTKNFNEASVRPE